MQAVQLTIFSPLPQKVTELALRLTPLNDLDVFLGAGPMATASKHLDAIWLTGMQITYFGLEPMFASGAKVVPTPPEKLALGLPPLTVAGWLLPEDASDPGNFGPQYAELMLRAVDEYNESSQNPILRIGSIPENLGLVGEYAQQAMDELVEILRERRKQQTRATAIMSNYSHA